MRPDAVVSTINQREYTDPIAYSKVKTKRMEKNNYELCKDLLRIALFSKISIDKNNNSISRILSFQAISSCIVLYVLSLVENGLYIFHEVENVVIPLSPDDLVIFICYAGRIFNVTNIYNEIDNTNNNNAIAISRKRTSLTKIQFGQFATKAKTSKDTVHSLYYTIIPIYYYTSIITHFMYKLNIVVPNIVVHYEKSILF